MNRSHGTPSSGDRTLRIAMIGVHGIPHTYGGGDELVLNLAPRLVERGHHVTVYCRSGDYIADRSPHWKGVERVFLPTVERKAAGQFIHSTLAMGHAIAHNFDVVYVHTLPSGVHTLMPYVCGQQIVVNVNGLDWEREKWGRLGRSYFKLAREVVLRTADEIVNDSQVMRQYYLDHFARDSTYIAYGAHVSNSQRPELLRRWNLACQGYYLVASRLVPENNADTIIDAYKQIDTDRPLIIAGTANFNSDWTQLVRAKADERVRFIGHVADPQVVRELHCNAYAYLHGHSMGGTNPSLLKALGCANCVVAYDSPFNLEVLRGDTGVIYGEVFHTTADLVHVLRRLEQSPEMVSSHQRAAPARIREAYSWDFVTDRYEAVFQQVANAKPRWPVLPALLRRAHLIAGTAARLEGAASSARRSMQGMRKARRSPPAAESPLGH